MGITRKAFEIRNEIFGVRDGKGYKAQRLGFKNLDERLGIVRGYPTYIGAVPGSGKTEFTLELLLQLSELHGWKHLVLTGETGKAEEIYAKLIHKHGKKPFMKISRKNDKILDFQTDIEADRNFLWVNEHFTVIDGLKIDITKPFRWDDLTKQLNDEMNIKGESYDTLTVDPFYEIDREDVPQTDGQLRALFHKVYRYCQDKNMVVFLTSHITQMKRDVKLLDGSYDRSEPTAFDFSGGQAWFQKGYNVLTLYKSNVLLDLPDGQPKWNELWVNVRKTKPDGTGKTGRIKLYFDYYNSNRYYEEINGEKLFCRDIREDNAIFVQNEIKPNTNWNEVDKDDDDLPF